MEINFCLTMLGILFMISSSRTDPRQSMEELINKWAPIIWLAPEEKFLPLSAEEFLSYVDVGDRTSTDKHFQLPFGIETEKFYLVTKRNLGSLLQEDTSFLQGKNPNEHSVPVYAVVMLCTPNLSFHSTSPNTISNTIRAINRNIETPPHFHVVYWVFYPYNEGKEICLIGKVPIPILFGSCLGHRKVLGNHVGDWEHISLSFTGDRYPSKLYISVHDAGAYYKYDPSSRLFKYENQVTKKGILQRPKFPIITRTRNNHPVLFSAKGSHGLWSAPGDHYYVKVPRLVDKSGYGISWETWNNLKIFYLGISSLPSWVKYKGKWGNPQSNCFLIKKLGLCEISDGPKGILERENDFQCSS